MNLHHDHLSIWRIIQQPKLVKNVHFYDFLEQCLMLISTLTTDFKSRCVVLSNDVTS